MFPGAYDPDRIAITMAGSHSQLTYGEVEAFSNQFAHLCRRHGLKQGDGIALSLENHLYFFPSAGVHFVQAFISPQSVTDFSLPKSSTSLMIQAQKY